MPPWASRLLHVTPIAAGAAILAGCVPAAAAAAAAPAPQPYVVAVDAGHGGAPDNDHPDQLYDSGAVSHGLVEKDLTLALAERLQKLLQQDGVKVVMTRTSDTYVDLSTRLQRAVDGGAKLYVSIHLNYFGDPGVEGSLVMYPGDASAPFAQLMANALEEGLKPYGMASNGIVLNDGLWIHSTVPTVTVEGAYLTNDHDAAMLARADVLDAMAASIRAGVEVQAPEILRLKKEMVARKAAAATAAARLAAVRSAFHLPGWAVPAATLLVAAVALFTARPWLARGLVFAATGVSAVRGRADAARASRYPRRRSRHRRRARASLRDLPTLQPRRR